MVVDHVRRTLEVSVRRACFTLGLPRSTYHYGSDIPDWEQQLTIRIIDLAHQYGRYGYRRITALLQAEGGR